MAFQDSLNHGNCTQVSKFILINIKLHITKINNAQTGMIFDNFFDSRSVLLAVQLVISHDQRDDSGVLFDSLDNVIEIRLQLVIRKVNSQQVVVIPEDLLADHDG